nr:MAG TPA: Immediate early response protein (IER) [Caudoviricetes sp.]
MNTNAVHNVLNVVIALLAAATAFLLATGCTTIATGALECSQSWIDPIYTTGAITALGVLKSLMNVFRDGFSGLLKKQPPVE